MSIKAFYKIYGFTVEDIIYRIYFPGCMSSLQTVFHKQAAEQLCPVWFLDWQANTKCVKAAGGRQEEGLGGWEGEGAEQQRHRLASPAPSTAWLYATANSLCPSSAQLHLRALRHLEGRREREEIEGWAGSSEFHCAILGCDVICRYQAYKQSSIFWG